MCKKKLGIIDCFVEITIEEHNYKSHLLINFFFLSENEKKRKKSKKYNS